jgi:hypothetical protein
MDDLRKQNAEENEKEEIFSYSIRAGKRIYYFDVRKTRKNDMYLSITESKKIITGEGENAQVSFEKHKIFLYSEDFSNFIDGLTKTITFIRESEKASSSTDESDAKEKIEEVISAEKSEDLNIEF